MLLKDTHAARAADSAAKITPAKELHTRCGIYTRPLVVSRILDAVGWTTSADLASASLLEPSAGDGAFVAEAARRLLAGFAKRGIGLTIRNLRGRILAYELYAPEARTARNRIFHLLIELGVHRRTADACARLWVKTGDFLLTKIPLESFTHVVGNPPYVRWSKVPSKLRASYARALPKEMIGGDLFLPFLDKSLELASQGGHCGFLCSDRWRFMAFAQAFRDKWLRRLTIQSAPDLETADAYTRSVDTYPTLLIATKLAAPRRAFILKRGKGSTLEQLGCTIKVGPALGCTPAFVLELSENDVEPELLRPWIDSSEIIEGRIEYRGRKVVTVYDASGKLVDLRKYPLLASRLRAHKKALDRRSIVIAGAKWYRTIDRVQINEWDRPKLLIPELAKVPRIAIDLSGAIPSHGVYAVFAANDDVQKIFELLANGKLARALEGIAPRVKGNYVRCYKRFLNQIVV